MFEVFADCALYGSFMRRFHPDKKAMLKWAYFNREPYRRNIAVYAKPEEYGDVQRCNYKEQDTSYRSV